MLEALQRMPVKDRWKVIVPCVLLIILLIYSLGLFLRRNGNVVAPAVPDTTFDLETQKRNAIMDNPVVRERAAKLTPANQKSLEDSAATGPKSN